LQDFETLYIGGAGAGVVRLAFVGLPSSATMGSNQDFTRLRQALSELAHHDGSDRLAVGSNVTSTRLNDERDWRAG
jgi:hypothetical protein